MNKPGDAQMSPDEFRTLGYRAIDAIAERMATLPDKPLAVDIDRAAMEALFREPLPDAPSDAKTVLDRVINDVLCQAIPIDHPRFFAFVPSPITPVSILADLLASAWNPFVGSWIAAPGPAMVELVTLDWLRETCNLPQSTSGIFTSGGSAANLTCLQIARDERVPTDHTRAVAYSSDQTHSAIDRALGTLGIPAAHRRVIATGDTFAIDMQALASAIKQDRAAGLVPWCVIASAGTTNTGTVDPLDAIADLCEAEQLWFHVDGAYGAAAAFCDSGKRVLQGMERADSLVLDPHKWLFQSYEIGCALVRDGEAMERTFAVHPSYLKDVATHDGHVNFRDRGLQLTRSFRALKLWMTFQIVGSSTIASWISTGIDSAEYAQQSIEAMKHWHIVTPAQLGVVTFRYAPSGMSDVQADAVNDAIAKWMLSDGTAFVTSTRLRDRTVQRLCTINPATCAADIQVTLDRYALAAAEVVQEI